MMEMIAERNCAVLSMRRDGRSYRDIAAAFNLSSARVADIIRHEEYQAFRREQAEAEKHKEFIDRTLEWLPLSYRVRRRFSELDREHFPQAPTSQLVTVADLLQWSADDLLKLKDFGRACLDEVDSLLAAQGLRLRQTRPTRVPDSAFVRERDLLHQILAEVKAIRALLEAR